MPRYAQLADGTRLEFPDDTPDEVIAATVKRMVQGGSGAPDINAGDRFVRGVASQLDPVAAVKGIASVASDPGAFIEGQRGAMAAQWEKAGQATNLPEKVARGLAGSIPLIGPAAAEIGERIGTSDDKATALGEATGLVFSAGLPMAAARGGRAALRAANKVRAPFAGELDPAVAAAAARTGQGIDLPAGAVSTAKPVATMEDMPPRASAASRWRMDSSSTGKRGLGRRMPFTARPSGRCRTWPCR